MEAIIFISEYVLHYHQANLYNEFNNFLVASLSGLVCSVAANLIVGSTYEGGLSDFYTNTAKDYSLLGAMISGFVVSGFVCVIVSLRTHTIKNKADAEREWSKTMNIDNPINPFRLIYAEELKTRTIITTKTMNHIFRKAKLIALVGGGVSLIVFLVGFVWFNF